MKEITKTEFYIKSRKEIVKMLLDGDVLISNFQMPLCVLTLKKPKNKGELKLIGFSDASRKSNLLDDVYKKGIAYKVKKHSKNDIEFYIKQ